MSVARFGVDRPVPANLLMVVLLIGGLIAGASLRREFFPETDPDQARITLTFPGASPEEVETALALKVEEALRDLDEVDKIVSTLAEGGGGIVAEFREDVAPNAALDEVERAVDALEDLPERAEKIQVELTEPRMPVIRLAVYGPVTERARKRAIRAVRDDLRQLPEMGELTIDGTRPYQIRVDVAQAAMLKHGLGIQTISDRIGTWMEDVPGGTLRGDTSNVKFRTLGMDEQASEIEQIPLTATPQGQSVKVGDVASVSDGFDDQELFTRVAGDPAAMLTVYKIGEQDIVEMANMVQAYVRGRRGEPFQGNLLAELAAGGRIDALKAVLPNDAVQQLNALCTTPPLKAYRLGRFNSAPIPAGASVAALSNLARFVQGRLELLIRNALQGAALVFATLLLFLNWRVALWVGAGLTTALFGTVLIMWALDITLNLLTMFGLIVVLGLLVDDAIVVAENVQARYEAGEAPLTAAVNGAQQVMWPVVATVLTSIVAFIPLTFIKGRIGDLLGALPLVVACALGMSLVESMLILPSHIGHTLRRRARATTTRFSAWFRRVEHHRDHLIMHRALPFYTKGLKGVLRFRYIAVIASIALLAVSTTVITSGHLTFTFLPSADAETVVVELRMPVGTPVARTDKMARRIDTAARAQPEVQSVTTMVGTRQDVETGESEASASHLAQLFIELEPVQGRDRTSTEVIDSIRSRIQPYTNQLDRLNFREITGGPGGPDISIEIRGDDTRRLRQTAAAVKSRLNNFAGVYEISDDEDRGQLEIQVYLKPAAAALGLSHENVATQVRGYLFGLDAHTFAANEEDIDVRVRAEKTLRRNLARLEAAWIVTPTGNALPLHEVARLKQSTGYATIKRIDGQRAITVTADTVAGVSPESITPRLNLDQIRRNHPGTTLTFAGRQERMSEAFASLPYGMLAALAMVYVILAWLFNSYGQPLVVMLVIPFAVIGVTWGHLLLGFDLTFLSIIGFVALSGIVVNDSLILVSFYNMQRAADWSVYESLIHAGRARLRPILLTTITTVLGLTPLMLEQSFQARFLIPMAIAVAFGLLSATVLILLVLPCFLLIFEDVKKAAHLLWFGTSRPRQ